MIVWEGTKWWKEVAEREGLPYLPLALDLPVAVILLLGYPPKECNLVKEKNIILVKY